MTVPAWKTWTALGIVYVVWGSTYLAIRYAVDGLPPLLVASFRFFVAAALLAAYVLVRRGAGAFRAPPRAWGWALLVGMLLLLGGNGGVMLAEDAHLPSGLTALLVAGVPIFVMALRLLTGDHPSPRTVLGVVIGFAGLAVLLLPGARPAGVAFWAAGLVVLASGLWSTGSFLAGKVVLPGDPLVVTIGEMLGGAVGLGAAGLLRREPVHLRGVHASAWLALLYLIVFGSVLAFTAYSWLLQTAPISQVATYAYVNPVVAVVLGALVAGEKVGVTSLVGGSVTLLAVFIVVSREGRRQSPIERQGRLRSSAT